MEVPIIHEPNEKWEIVMLTYIAGGTAFLVISGTYEMPYHHTAAFVSAVTHWELYERLIQD